MPVKFLPLLNPKSLTVIYNTQIMTSRHKSSLLERQRWRWRPILHCPSWVEQRGEVQAGPVPQMTLVRALLWRCTEGETYPDKLLASSWRREVKKAMQIVTFLWLAVAKLTTWRNFNPYRFHCFALTKPIEVEKSPYVGQMTEHYPTNPDMTMEPEIVGSLLDPVNPSIGKLSLHDSSFRFE